MSGRPIGFAARAADLWRHLLLMPDAGLRFARSYLWERECVLSLPEARVLTKTAP